jgi:uncharacterized membrane protein YeaQ/YmgE (transglycosylase-associated protein family)
MVLFVWIALGLMVGILASKRFHHTASALALDVTLGVAGAIAGGLAIDSLGVPQPTAFLIAGLMGAAAGAAAMLAGYRVIFRRA